MMANETAFAATIMSGNWLFKPFRLATTHPPLTIFSCHIRLRLTILLWLRGLVASPDGRSGLVCRDTFRDHTAVADELKSALAEFVRFRFMQTMRGDK